MKFSTVKIISIFAILFVFGCSSSADKQRLVEAIAQHRATTLSNSLPIEHGPLTIMQAKARGNAVELMMLYNGDDAIPAQALMTNSVNYYCTNSDVRANLEHGIIYDIKMRSPRGQLLLEKVISLDTCQSVEDQK